MKQAHAKEGGLPVAVTLNLRQAIVQKVKNKPDEDIVDMIEGSIDYDERALPGLGVLFEMIWKASSSEARQQLIDTLQSKLQDEQAGK
ncbi:small acid-soluble spore protein SspI [Paenibacillus sp. KS1]|uniref:Small, acid-soluble spore protein I n=1 Tax=Paenibacillus popilliae TaxID=78057 RepID=A0ABY3AJ35_PAEPP|nr:small, acid-soluble spore protein I [Paenibacillus alvei A6-6i-x]OBY77103.1 small acid-soluble spore protein SspI [Paenibacillus sp. KS1]TQR42261.1 small acid-soluble spore protein SspI [Paenibacillus sp. SDF0028]